MVGLGKIFKSILGALQYVHEAGWVHNDIKDGKEMLLNTLVVTKKEYLANVS